MKDTLLLMRRWTRMVLGRSYYHIPQGVGKAFQPGVLSGYFNDLTGKTDWKGLLDDNGIPVIQLQDGSVHHFPTTIIQKALGHYDRFLLQQDPWHSAEFLRLCDWLAGAQDGKGGWQVGRVLSLQPGLHYSAMPQGEAVSALVRAWKYTQDARYREAAVKAYDLMLTPLEQGGTASVGRDGALYLEECPGYGKNTILNGWIFALFGIHDMHLATGEGRYREAFDRSLRTLCASLKGFDSGRWSYYDERRRLASPFYHQLHICQLSALYQVSRDTTVLHYMETWQKYRESIINRSAALVSKAVEKLRNPSPVIVVR